MDELPWEKPNNVKLDIIVVDACGCANSQESFFCEIVRLKTSFNMMCSICTFRT